MIGDLIAEQREQNPFICWALQLEHVTCSQPSSFYILRHIHHWKSCRSGILLEMTWPKVYLLDLPDHTFVLLDEDSSTGDKILYHNAEQNLYSLRKPICNQDMWIIYLCMTLSLKTKKIYPIIIFRLFLLKSFEQTSHRIFYHTHLSSMLEVFLIINSI